PVGAGSVADRSGVVPVGRNDGRRADGIVGVDPVADADDFREPAGGGGGGVISVTARSVMVVGGFGVPPMRRWGQSIQPLGLPGSVPVCPPAMPSMSTISGQTKTVFPLSFGLTRT